MANGSLKLFFVMLFNKADERDDDMLKISAKTKPHAMRVARDYVQTHTNLFLGEVYTRKQLKRCQPEWHSLLWGTDPINKGAWTHG
jgi:hypothetical protein